MSKHLLAALIICYTPFCFSAPSSFDQKFNQLQIKMTPAQVDSILGPPDLREVSDHLEIWHYTANGGRKTIFTDGKLSSFGIDEKPVSAAPIALTPAPTPYDLSVGQECKTDDECKEKNCHFHLCAGKNNCTVPLGKLCATDSQCCSGKCDFQVCKKR